MTRTIVVGDVHGCISELRALVAKLVLQPSDRVVFLGDLIDKGPSSAACVHFARKIGAITILGNHEDKMLRYLAHEERRLDTGKANPMRVSPERAAQWETLSAQDLEWLRASQVALKIGGNFLAVHAGLVPGVELAKQKASTMIRVRHLTTEGKFLSLSDALAAPERAIEWQSMYDGEHNLVVGHEVHSLGEPRVDRLPNGHEVWNLDTGCVHGGHLTAMILETREIVQVRAAREYCPRKGGAE